jgi:hypothetical protein
LRRGCGKSAVRIPPGVSALITPNFQKVRNWLTAWTFAISKLVVYSELSGPGCKGLFLVAAALRLKFKIRVASGSRRRRKKLCGSREPLFQFFPLMRTAFEGRN